VGQVSIVDHSAGWAVEYAVIAEELRRALGRVATGIDHVGSTSIVGLAAKDVIDVQVSVADLSALERTCTILENLGYLVNRNASDHRVPGLEPDETAWRKAFASERDGQRRTHIHVRIRGAPNQEYALLFRDYLREHPLSAAAYASFKTRAAQLLADDSTLYSELKDPVGDLIFYPAMDWARSTDWRGAEILT
jgi:GrpB-like predicted nucleotidyltransferase (UPF0157 family)